MSYESVTTVGEGEREEGEREGERPTHLAFGTNMPIPEHILASRKSARSTACYAHCKANCCISKGRQEKRYWKIGSRWAWPETTLTGGAY